MLHQVARRLQAVVGDSPLVRQLAVQSTFPPSAYVKLEAQFRRFVGADAIEKLRALPPAQHPVIIIAGDQCTGKSTLSKRLAKTLSGRSFAAGELFRRRAKELGITSAELSRRALSDPSIDVGIEYNLCQLICTGDAAMPLVIEGRQPAVMEGFLRSCLDRKATFRLRLTCTAEQQAARFIEREYGVDVLRAVTPYLSANATRLSDLTPGLQQVPRAEMAAIIRAFEDNDSRDEDDRKRFEALYSANEYLDHRNPALYDAIIDTTPNQPADTYQQG